MVARAKKTPTSEFPVADMFAMPASDEEDSYRNRKAKGRCKERERSIKKMRQQADDKEQEAPSNVQEDPNIMPVKNGRSSERERSCHGRQKKEKGEEREKKAKSRSRSQQPSAGTPGHPGGVWDSPPVADSSDFIAAMKAAGQKIIETREQEEVQADIAKAEEANRQEASRRRRELQAREEELRVELHQQRELEALQAESARAVAAVKANTTGETKTRSRASSGEQTKTVAFADLVHAEPAKDAAESPFDDLFGWVVL